MKVSIVYGHRKLQSYHPACQPPALKLGVCHFFPPEKEEDPCGCTKQLPTKKFHLATVPKTILPKCKLNCDGSIHSREPSSGLF